MPAFESRPPMTITAAPTVGPSDRPITITFVPPTDTTGTGTASRPITFPLSSVVSGGDAALFPRLVDNLKHNGCESGSESSSSSDSDADSDDEDNSTKGEGIPKGLPGRRNVTFGKAKKTCRAGSTSTSPSTTSLPLSQSPFSPHPRPSPPTQSPTPSVPPSTQSASTDVQPPSSTKSRGMGGTGITAGSSSNTTSRRHSSPFNPPSATSSSDSGVSAVNMSLPPTPIPNPTQASSTNPTSGLSAGCEVAIALGVFTGVTVLVAAAVFLFLFLRRRKYRHNCGSADPTSKRPRTLPEGSLSRPLSSTLSWLGTLPIASDYDHSEHRRGYAASTHTRDHPFYDPGEEQGSARPPHAPSPNPVQVGSTLVPNPHPESGVARVPARVSRDRSAFTLP